MCALRIMSPSDLPSKLFVTATWLRSALHGAAPLSHGVYRVYVAGWFVQQREDGCACLRTCLGQAFRALLLAVCCLRNVFRWWSWSIGEILIIKATECNAIACTDAASPTLFPVLWRCRSSFLTATWLRSMLWHVIGSWAVPHTAW
jgi:hypothetical protein